MSKSASWSPKSRTKFLQSHGMDGTAHGILTCPIFEYTPKSQCPVPSYSPVGWTGLSTGFSHVPSSSIPPNPSVPSHPTVLWDGRDCPWDSHMSHPQVYPQIPVSRPVLQSVGWTGLSTGFSHVPSSSIPPNVPSHPTVLWDGRDCPWDSHMFLKYTPKSQCPVPSCNCGKTVHGILTCPILKYTPKSQSHPTVLWDGRDCPWDSHMSHPQVYPQIPVSRPVLQSCGMDGTVN